MIVIDIGNTSVVIGIYSKNKLKKVFRLNTEKNKIKSKKIFTKFFKSQNKFFLNSNKKICVISSVVPSINSIIKNYFIKNKYKFYDVNPKKIPFDIKINYNLNQIGSDRIANYISIYNKRIKNCIIIDFGTATTFDVIKNKEYFGGLIFPGINLSMNTLIKNAELLKKSKIIKSKKIIGRNTVTSIQSGFYFGYLHLINGILKQISVENKFKPKIYITGGLGKIFKDKIIFNPIYSEYLTLDGLRLIGNKIYDE